MALLPTIPTSFVPHVPGAPAERSRSDGGGSIFAYICYGLLLISFLMAIVVFAYGQLLTSQKAQQDAALKKAEQSIDQATVEGFVRLRDRLNYADQELKQHIAFSTFFNALVQLMPSTVRFSTMHLQLGTNGGVTLDASGSSKTFNALAALSAAFAQDGRVKNAIFSKIGVKPDGSVSFNLTANLDPSLVAFTPNAMPPTSSVGTTPATTTVPMMSPYTPPNTTP